MAKISRLAGSTSHVLTVFVQDATSTTGGGLTGLTFGSAGLTCYYKRNRGTGATAVPLATITTLGTFVSGGFKEVDAVNMPGVYEFHPPDAAMAAGSGSVAFLLRGAANMVPCPLEIELTAVNNQDAQAGGITALPGTGTLLVKPAVTLAAADVNGGLPIDLTTVVAPSNVTGKTTQTIADCLSVARAEGAGAVDLVGTTLTLRAPDGTAIRVFTLTPNATAPTSRS